MSEFGTLIPRGTLGPINAGIHSATEETMRSLLGHPKGTLTTADQPELASDTVQRLLETRNFGLFRATGIKPALDSLQTILNEVKKNPQLFAAVGSAGMLSVRLKKPTSGAASTEVSNHAWGTAIDITIDGVADTNPDDMVQRGIAALIPLFNDEGWFSGVGFTSSEDDTHFEVAEETIQAWAAEGLFDPPAAETGLIAANLGQNLGRRAFDFFVSTGWSKPQAAGLVANIEAESSFNADLVGDSGLAFGLCQWHPDRQANFESAFGHSIKESSFDDQLKFVNFELRQGKETKAGQAIAVQSTALEAGATVCVAYERPGNPERDAPRRGARAEQLLTQFA